MLPSDTYRQFKQNYVFAQFEEKIQLRPDGETFNSPGEIAFLRKQLIE